MCSLVSSFKLVTINQLLTLIDHFTNKQLMTLCIQITIDQLIAEMTFITYVNLNSPIICQNIILLINLNVLITTMSQQ